MDIMPTQETSSEPLDGLSAEAGPSAASNLAMTRFTMDRFYEDANSLFVRASAAVRDPRLPTYPVQQVVNCLGELAMIVARQGSP
jgi:hypothetical protein